MAHGGACFARRMLDALLHLEFWVYNARLSKQKSAAGYRLHLGQSTLVDDP